TRRGLDDSWRYRNSSVWVGAWRKRPRTMGRMPLPVNTGGVLLRRGAAPVAAPPSAVVLDVVAHVFLVRVVLFLLHRIGLAAGHGQRTLARLGRAHGGGERKETLRIRRTAGRACRCLVRL